MNNPTYLWVSILYEAIIIASSVTWLVYAGLGGSEGSKPSRRTGVALVAGLIFSWLGLVMLLGGWGLFKASLDPSVPYLAFSFALPILAGCWFMFGTRRGGELVRSMPQEWTIGIQAYRGLGAIFLILNGLSLMPSEFAIPAGFGDVITGILAIPVAAYYSSTLPGRKFVAVVWNVFGLADLVLASTLGFLTSPSPFQLLAIDHPNLLATQFPLVLVPVFAVPISILLHIASLKKLVARL